jgi:hypothetical protein
VPGEELDAGEREDGGVSAEGDGDLAGFIEPGSRGVESAKRNSPSLRARTGDRRSSSAPVVAEKLPAVRKRIARSASVWPLLPDGTQANLSGRIAARPSFVSR